MGYLKRVGVIGTKSSQQGFVMVASIWLVFIMLVFAGAFSFYASDQVSAAIAAKQRLVDQFDRHGTEKSLLYVLAVGKKNRRDINVPGAAGQVIRLDGKTYKGSGSTRFRVNDLGGLIPLNGGNTDLLEKLLVSFEPQTLRRRALLNALADYIDMDRIARIGSKEARGYARAGLPVPTNNYLKSAEELRAVYGWREWLGEHPGFELNNWLSTNWRSVINLNTMPAPLFSSVLGITDDEARKLIQVRRLRHFKNLDDVLNLLNYRVTLDDDFFTFIPTGAVKVRIYSENSRKLSTMLILPTPLDTRQPWVVDYRYQREHHLDTSLPAGILTGHVFGGQYSSDG